MDAAVMRALQAFYLASCGQVGRADSPLKHCSRVAKESGHMTLKVVCATTRGLLLIHSSTPEVAVEQLESALRIAETHQNVAFIVYSLEALSKAHFLAEQPGPASETITRARHLRKTIGMDYLPVDKIRLSNYVEF